ncbi:MAG: DUF294 nucleotidyltransferase-like domain-containing protein [Planctomycetota bacterium]
MQHPQRDHRLFALVRIALPPACAVALFVIAIHAIIVPATEQALIARKREMIRELTHSAWNLLRHFAEDEAAGRLSSTEAQQEAVALIRAMRYGDRDRDYLWITDLHPRMIMHPYREDLEGLDLSGFTDPHGKRLFVAYTEAVRESPTDEAYIDYMWQWKDEPGRVVPKPSYVRLFEPWGWVIGSGMYLEDGRQEVATVTRRLTRISLMITAVIAMLLLFTTWRHWRVELRHRAAGDALRRSRERYRALVEASREGVLLAVDGRVTDANATACALLGVAEDAVDGRELSALLSGEKGAAILAAVTSGGEQPRPQEVGVHLEDGRRVELLVSVARIEVLDRDGIILTLRDPTHGRGAESDDELIRLRAELAAHENRAHDLADRIADLEAGARVLERPCRDLARPAIRLPLDSPLGEALAACGDAAAILTGPDGGDAGLLEPSELGRRLADDALAPESLAYTVMRAPIPVIAADASVAACLDRLLESPGATLAVRDARSRITGTLGWRDLLRPLHAAPANLAARIARCTRVEDLQDLQHEVALTQQALLRAGTAGRLVTALGSRLADSILARIIQLVVQQRGPAPCAFAFMVIGSQGRGEQSLITDQDNALVYAAEGDDPVATRSWFHAFAEAINQAYAAAGYALCRGEAMARNPKWCLPLAQWQKTFTGWIFAPDRQDLIDVGIFFDFRCVHGDPDLASALRSHVLGAARGRDLFFLQLAGRILDYRPPLSLFGGLRAEERPERGPVLDVKQPLNHLVDFARIYALRHGIHELHTPRRLRALRDAGVLTPASCRDLAEAFDLLTELRLRHQEARLAEGRVPDNLLELDELSRWDHALLRMVFAHLSTMQSRLRYDFARQA